MLSDGTGHARNYNHNFYAAYFRSPQLMFPVKPSSRRLPAKQPVLGVWAGEAARAYPLSALGNKPHTLDEQLDGRGFGLEFDPDERTLRVTEADDGVEWMYSFWFAWYAFHPKTEVYRPARR